MLTQLLVNLTLLKGEILMGLLLLLTLILSVGTPTSMYLSYKYPDDEFVQAVCFFAHVFVLCPLAIVVLFLAIPGLLHLLMGTHF